MRHLRAVFHEKLADPDTEDVGVTDGVIYIRERRWAPGNLLLELGDKIHDELFESWLAERREVLAARAKKVLTEHRQLDRFEKLKAVYQTANVLPFVGAGLSIPSQYLGWTSFLRALWENTTLDPARIEVLLGSGRYEQAAQELADRMGVRFSTEVEEAYGIDRDLRGPVQLFPHVFGSAVVTTNFDDVLKRSYEAEGKPFADVIPGLQAGELPRLLGAGRRVLLKLHGTATSGTSRVLTASEYDRAYGGAFPLHRVVESICSRTLLFVGCSLSVDRLLAAMRDFVHDRGHDDAPRHYALLAAPPTPAERIDREDELAQLNIYPIWYPRGEDNDLIEGFLYRLSE